METLFPMRLSRRGAMAAGAAAVAGVTLTSSAALAVAQRAVSSGGGLAGGGAIQGPDADVNFVVSGSRFELEDETLFFGRLQLTDAAQGVSLESVEISFYGPIDGGPENARELQGLAAVEGNGVQPFVLHVEVGEAGAAESNTVTLSVGAQAAATPTVGTPSPVEFAYELNGTLSSGGLVLLTFDFGEN